MRKLAVALGMTLLTGCWTSSPNSVTVQLNAKSATTFALTLTNGAEEPSTIIAAEFGNADSQATVSVVECKDIPGSATCVADLEFPAGVQGYSDQLHLFYCDQNAVDCARANAPSISVGITALAPSIPVFEKYEVKAKNLFVQSAGEEDTDYELMDLDTGAVIHASEAHLYPNLNPDIVYASVKEFNGLFYTAIRVKYTSSEASSTAHLINADFEEVTLEYARTLQFSDWFSFSLATRNAYVVVLETDQGNLFKIKETAVPTSANADAPYASITVEYLGKK